MGEQFYYARDGHQRGPVTKKRIKELASIGELLPSDLIWTEGMPGWAPAAMFKGLLPHEPTNSVPPPLPQVARQDFSARQSSPDVTVTGAGGEDHGVMDALPVNDPAPPLAKSRNSPIFTAPRGEQMLVIGALFLVGGVVIGIGVVQSLPHLEPSIGARKQMTTAQFENMVRMKKGAAIIEAAGKPQQTQKMGDSEYWYYNNVG